MTTHPIVPTLAVFAAHMFMLTGCAPSLAPHPDLGVEATKATGISDAIAFHGPEDAVSETAGLSNVLSIQEAVRAAIQADPNIRAALARVRASEADCDQAMLLPNPILNIAFKAPTVSGKAKVEMSLTEDLLSILQRPGRIEAADNRLRVTSAEALATILDLIAEVQERYSAVQSLDALMPVLEERHKLVERLMKLAQDRLKQGEGTRLDVTILNAQRLELEVEIAEKKAERRNERFALGRLLGNASNKANVKLAPWTQPLRARTSELSWMLAAMEHRPEINARRWELAALGVEVRLSRFAPFDGSDVGVTSEYDQLWYVGPTITTPVPLFDWGQARRAKAQALRDEARHNFIRVRRQVVEEVLKAYATFDAALSATALVRDELLPAQEARRSQTEAAYIAGLTDITALILAEQDLHATRTKLIELEQKSSTAQTRLERAVGGAGVASAIAEVAPGAPASKPLIPASSRAP
jgi:outer membrane protein TolC